MYDLWPQILRLKFPLKSLTPKWMSFKILMTWVYFHWCWLQPKKITTWLKVSTLRILIQLYALRTSEFVLLHSWPMTYDLGCWTLASLNFVTAGLSRAYKKSLMNFWSERCARIAGTNVVGRAGQIIPVAREINRGHWAERIVEVSD